MDELVIQGRRRRYWLRLTSTGFVMSYGWRTSEFAWHEIVGRFEPGFFRYVAFNVSQARLKRKRLFALVLLAQRAVFGFHAQIDPVPYGRSQEELVRLLNEWHDRYAPQPPSPN